MSATMRSSAQVLSGPGVKLPQLPNEIVQKILSIVIVDALERVLYAETPEDFKESALLLLETGYVFREISRSIVSFTLQLLSKNYDILCTAHENMVRDSKQPSKVITEPAGQIQIETLNEYETKCRFAMTLVTDMQVGLIRELREDYIRRLEAKNRELRQRLGE